MSSCIGRTAFRATAPFRDANRAKDVNAIKQGAKRDPELFPLYFITAAVFGWAGYRFVHSPTGADSSAVGQIPNSEPWKDENTTGKFKYQLGGEVKEAPSALNTVIIPNVTLPKELHEKYNKYGKEGF